MLYARTRKPEDQGKPSFYFFSYLTLPYLTLATYPDLPVELLSKSTSIQVKHALFDPMTRCFFSFFLQGTLGLTLGSLTKFADTTLIS